MVEALALAAGQPLRAAAVTRGNASLEDLWREGAALRAIGGGGWDVVVLQQGPSSLPESQRDLRFWSQRFAARIRAAGARPALYMVWPPRSRLHVFPPVSQAYATAAADVDGLLCPAGEVWRAAWRRDPAAPLYAADEVHPSPAGSYAAALAIVAALLDRPPTGLPARLESGGRVLVSLEPALAAVLQEAAGEAYTRWRKPAPAPGRGGSP
jgi:hypothetical protein